MGVEFDETMEVNRLCTGNHPVYGDGCEYREGDVCKYFSDGEDSLPTQS